MSRVDASIKKSPSGDFFMLDLQRLLLFCFLVDSRGAAPLAELFKLYFAGYEFFVF